MVQPLSHHQILARVAPFSAAGWTVDLAACDRARRLIAFEPVSHAGLDAAPGPVTEHLALSEPEPGRYRLSATYTAADGTRAGLRIDGDRPADLLARYQAAEVRPRLFVGAAGVCIGRSYRSAAGAAGGGEPLWRAVAAEAQVAGRRVTLDATPGAGLPGQIAITPHADGEPPLPEDLLAVLGWGWRPLVWRQGAWRSTLALRRHEPRRRDDVEARTQQLVAHLAAVFAAPPSGYHRRYRRQRWAAVGRRLLPMTVFFLVLAAVPLFGVVLQEGEMPPWLHGVPPLLAIGALLFSGTEVPLVDWPPLPRPLHATTWQGGADGG
ncbi:hypothetical protein [Halorhodospira halophila]|uniref:Uncharacterized protein n=1 Tax=Halorhodospira halophila (strain DSM 244 / SL1) TaxID=349124 RepID=A1WTN2_HALHL|nr:hypothetical protein [Halorhodospira halophila]ABM61044.1 conserved hypothetical protein [Halorhodospira halophila SL1]MBK1730130.1 hypothetical protein [Halorhodospira halophila]